MDGGDVAGKSPALAVVLKLGIVLLGIVDCYVRVEGDFLRGPPSKNQKNLKNHKYNYKIIVFEIYLKI